MVQVGIKSERPSTETNDYLRILKYLHSCSLSLQVNNRLTREKIQPNQVFLLFCYKTPIIRSRPIFLMYPTISNLN